ncbi:MAG: flagellum-specific ATP synthase FliI, partial [Gammaproteobacteria bacterium]
ERAGNAGPGGGSITGIYTVLTEGDDVQDPVADAARAVLDGHIVLSRRVAERGRYPAIDVEASISRVMSSVVKSEHHALAQRFRQIYARYEQNRDLINVGAYKKGTDPAMDEAIDLFPRMERFLAQAPDEAVDFDASLAQLEACLDDGLRTPEGG